MMMTRILVSMVMILGVLVAPFNSSVFANQGEPMKKVLIDPGHGGKDSGAVGNGLQEKVLTLKIAQKLDAHLRNTYMVETKMTRTADTFPSLMERTSLANSWGADFYISIHINSGGGTGYEDFTFMRSIPQPQSVNGESKEIQVIIHDEIKKVLVKYGVRDRGSKEANFQVLRETKMPALLTELMFIDTKKDADLLKNENFINDISVAHSIGIAKALNLPVKQVQPNPEPSKPEENPISPPVTAPSTAKDYVTTANLHLRESAGVKYKILTTAKKGTKIKVTKTQKIGKENWGNGTANGKTGWMSMEHMSIPKTTKPPIVTAPPAPSSSKVYTTTVNLNLRANAGVNNKIVTTAKKGIKITITKTQKVGKETWGYGTVNGKKGWMSMEHMSLPKTTSPPTVTTPSLSKIYTTTANLNLRANSGINSKIVTTAKKGTKITITKTKMVGKTTWGYGTVNKKTGWLSMAYVKITASKPVTPPVGALPTTKTYVTKASLNLRTNAGLNNKIVTTAKKGTKVTITKTKMVGKITWGFGTVNKKSGWMSMDYMSNK
jgi:N-acetylmuramoyl-L-alanine amidase